MLFWISNIWKIDPKSFKKYSIFSKKGKILLKKYILNYNISAGSSSENLTKNETTVLFKNLFDPFSKQQFDGNLLRNPMRVPSIRQASTSKSMTSSMKPADQGDSFSDGWAKLVCYVSSQVENIFKLNPKIYFSKNLRHQHRQASDIEIFPHIEGYKNPKDAYNKFIGGIPNKDRFIQIGDKEGPKAYGVYHVPSSIDTYKKNQASFANKIIIIKVFTPGHHTMALYDVSNKVTYYFDSGGFTEEAYLEGLVFSREREKKREKDAIRKMNNTLI